MKKTDKPLGTGGKRTLRLLTDALSELMAKKSFDDITVKEICALAMVPHSTFYNYFEDKFDLLRTLFDEFFDNFVQLNVGRDFNLQHIEDSLEKVMLFCLENKRFLQKLKSADINGTFSRQLHDYMAKEIHVKLRQLEEAGGQLRLPAELLAEYYAVNIVYLGKWWLQRPTEIPMPELKTSAPRKKAAICASERDAPTAKKPYIPFRTPSFRRQSATVSPARKRSSVLSSRRRSGFCFLAGRASLFVLQRAKRGQVRHSGEEGRHTVAPNSIRLCVKSPRRFAG